MREHERKAGYVDAVLKIGKVTGDLVELTEEQFQDIRKRFALEPEERRKLGLGDLVGKVATPIARALKMPCIDPATNDLRPESGCAQRKKMLNKIQL